MTVTKVGVVYSKAQKVRRRLIKLDHAGAHDGEFEHHKKHLHPNEGWLEIPIGIYETFDHAALEDYIAQQIGAASSDRCAVVCPQGNVLHVIRADPEIDTHPAGKIIHHPTAIVGDKI